MDATAAVERALPVFSTTPPGDWKALRAAVARTGVPDSLAADVAAFMPIAFGRSVLEGTGIEFSPEYARPSGAGVQTARLDEHPVYAAAAALAARMMERQEGGEAFVGVAVWSAEFAAANEALHAGSDLADLVAGPPLIADASADDPAPTPAPASAPAGTPAAAPAAPATARPWWKVWG